ncbi:prolipoprotein diacylglyceryl transferase [Kordiimonas sp. SCSIO 12603]|uniref:prolipoprotein diacylglyceryl transferase n=1 Tax=Kordiimonas sp. SCSIO 12603 TaxID=2829596 RepID=UPI00210368A9|nr:prolipoprotein diacylglyceryl transferase [Kordiimonas sp. SCSIO 12603]UTW60117.1 prolipoprotein diacylglyceryl transferase [Kordiimonas sp. SCSIO 12603]
MTLGVIPYPQIDPVLIDFGFIAIRWYSMAYLGGILFAWWYIRRLSGQPGAAMSRDHIDDFITWAVFGIILGGRLGYVFFYDFAKYMADPVGIIRFWDGGLTGMSFHGGFAGVVIAVILYVRKHKLDLMRVADTVAIVSPIGLLVGRIANFVNGELWGRPTDVPWAMVFPSDPSGLARHPSQLYEALGEGLILFIVLQLLYHKTRVAKDMPGVLAGLFIAGYGLTRVIVEFVREPDAHIGLIAGISRGQMLSVPMFLLAAWLISKGIRHKKALANKG